MHSVRVRRRSFIDLRRIMVGDWIILVASAFTLLGLFMPWITETTPTKHDDWAFTYSEWTSVIVIVFFLATLFLVTYPALSPDLGLAPLPFATPLIFFGMGAFLLLIFTYELGKYACIACQTTSRGYGIWVAWVAAFVFLVGAIIKWGSRPVRRTG
jgi:hypothetical protein